MTLISRLEIQLSTTEKPLLKRQALISSTRNSLVVLANSPELPGISSLLTRMLQVRTLISLANSLIKLRDKIFPMNTFQLSKRPSTNAQRRDLRQVIQSLVLSMCSLMVKLTSWTLPLWLSVLQPSTPSEKLSKRLALRSSSQ